MHLDRLVVAHLVSLGILVASLLSNQATDIDVETVRVMMILVPIEVLEDIKVSKDVEACKVLKVCRVCRVCQGLEGLLVHLGSSIYEH
ncbi:Hypothetical protein POVR2_LOCUS160 [uncultured virus]|nr:Hypothetical protein POVR2_LOCUS160 [uncultured virus]